jgi:hypothetical protein
MDGFSIFALVVAGLAFFGGLAIRFGVDTTPASEETHQPVGLTL